MWKIIEISFQKLHLLSWIIVLFDFCLKLIHVEYFQILVNRDYTRLRLTGINVCSQP